MRRNRNPVAKSVLNIVNEAVAMIAPSGPIADEHGDDLEDVQLIGVALVNLFKRNEKRGLMPRWIDNGNGTKTYDPSSAPTPEEIAETERRDEALRTASRESVEAMKAGRPRQATAPMEEPTDEDLERWARNDAEWREVSRQNVEAVKAGKPPVQRFSKAPFNLMAACTAFGLLPSEGRQLWSDGHAFDSWCKARGYARTTPQEKARTASGATPKKRATPEEMKAQAEAMAAEAFDQVTTGMVPQSFPENGNGNGHAKRFSVDPLPAPDVDPDAPDVDHSANVVDVPMDQRPNSDTTELDSGLYDYVVASAKARRGIA